MKITTCMLGAALALLAGGCVSPSTKIRGTQITQAYANFHSMPKAEAVEVIRKWTHTPANARLSSKVSPGVWALGTEYAFSHVSEEGVHFTRWKAVVEQRDLLGDIKHGHWQQSGELTVPYAHITKIVRIPRRPPQPDFIEVYGDPVIEKYFYGPLLNYDPKPEKEHTNEELEDLISAFLVLCPNVK